MGSNITSSDSHPMPTIETFREVFNVVSLHREAMDLKDNGVYSESTCRRAKDLSDRIEDAEKTVPRLTASLMTSRRQATVEEIGLAIGELSQSRALASSGGNRTYGRLMTEEVISEGPSYGALRMAVRELWRSQRADQRPPEIGDVLAALKSKEDYLDTLVRMLGRMREIRLSIEKIIAQYESSQVQELSSECRRAIQEGGDLSRFDAKMIQDNRRMLEALAKTSVERQGIE